MDMTQYLDVFIDESNEHLQAINDHLLELEQNPDNLEIVNEIFRSAHTLKGMSATMGYEDLANLTHKMENVLDAIRNHKIAVTTELLDVVFRSVDDLEAMVVSISGGGDGKRDVTEIVQMLQAIERGESSSTNQKEVAQIGETTENYNDGELFDEYELAVINDSIEQGYTPYKVTITLQETCMLKGVRAYMVFQIIEQIGEIVKSEPPVDELEEEEFDLSFKIVVISKEPKEEIQAKINKVSEIDKVEIEELHLSKRGNSSARQVEGKEETKQIVEKKSKQETKSAKFKKEPQQKKKQIVTKTIRVNIERLDILMNLFEELVVDRGRLEQIAHELNKSELNETVERMSRVTGDLQNIILTMRMVPVDQVFNRFPRMVRGLARDLNKKIKLDIIGAETELDRTVIDEIGDPLVHLLRNAIDHGIEMPKERIKAGKQETGTVTLRAYHSGNHVFIEIEDDGAGIDRDKILQKAIEREIVTPEQGEKLTDKQVYQLLFASGFSTAEKVSDVSGRGVGLDVVKSTIESLGGSVSVDSQQGVGSLWSIQLPLTLSIISVMLVELQKEKYAIPLSSIIETAIIKNEEIFSAHGNKVIDFRGKIVPLLFLNEIFDVPQTTERIDPFYSIIIVRKGEKLAGLVVDSFIGQQEVVLKSLGNYLTNVFAISGATILGDGQVALIVDCNALIK
ncbi:MAG TPA: chemotaxis protein CheA [Massilibacterium sp.]|nr:chemotaxis protein CheA [Massilibacterium sp.]